VPAPADAAELLLLRAATSSGAEARLAFTRWAAATDIDALAYESQLLLPLVARAALREGVEHPCLERLRGVHRYHWARNQLALGEAARLLVALEGLGVAARLAGGAAVGAALGLDLGARPLAGPVDVVVGRRDLARALRAAAGLRLEGMRIRGPRRWERGDAGGPLRGGARPLRLPGGLTAPVHGPAALLCDACAGGPAGRDAERLLRLADAALLLRAGARGGDLAPLGAALARGVRRGGCADEALRALEAVAAAGAPVGEALLREVRRVRADAPLAGWVSGSGDALAGAREWAARRGLARRVPLALKRGVWAAEGRLRSAWNRAKEARLGRGPAR